MDAARKSFPELVRFSLVTLAIYFALQAIVVVLHEHAHSTAAWLLGYTSTPFTVVWGNPITILGWDEGVPYDQIFPSAGHAAEAVIGGVPLLMHALFVGLGFYPPAMSIFFAEVHLLCGISVRHREPDRTRCLYPHASLRRKWRYGAL